jgi:hypothetical protein
LTAEGGPEADAGARKPVVAGWAEENRVKVERERSDRTLTRFCGANRRGPKDGGGGTSPPVRTLRA